MSVTISGTNGIDKVQDGTIQSADFAAGVPGRSNLPAGTVLQVVSTTSNSALTINTTTFTEISGLTTSITPISATSKILILGVVRFASLGNNTDTQGHFRLRRDSTDICLGSGASGNMVNVTASAFDNDNDVVQANVPINYLDSPATTSAVSYKIMAASHGSGMSINVPVSPDGAFYNGFVTSTLTLMEIAA